MVNHTNMLHAFSTLYFILLHLFCYCNSIGDEKGHTTDIKCENEYIYTNLTNKSWLNPTPNRFHALYNPHKLYYSANDLVRFHCPPGQHFQGAAGLWHGESMCLSDTRWSRQWPMCKGDTCDRLRIPDGYVEDENRPLPPGTVVTMRCWPGFYLWGYNQSRCTERLHWTHHDLFGKARECVRKETYRKYCENALMTFSVRPDGELQCIGDHDPDPIDVSNHTRQIILGASVPLSSLFIIFLVISIMYARRIQAYHRRMAAIVRYQNNADQSINLVLPSYDDAVKSTPTTPPPSYFEDSITMLQAHDVSRESGSRYLSRPPAYDDG